MTTFPQRPDERLPPPVKYLLVDDLEENLLALSALLARDDVELLTARSGVEALELLLVHDVALAFLDVQMPTMDGFELAELMRGSERTRNVPLIFVTAGAHDQRRLFKGYESGAVDFIFKPIEPHIIKSKADVFFQLYRHKQQLAYELQNRTETLRLNEMFIAVLGHDLRSPLNAIVMSAYMLQHASAPEEAHLVAEQLLSSGRRMGRMIEDMLDLARARLAGGIALKREPVELRALVERVVQEYRATYPARCIEVYYEGNLNGEWDADRLLQVIANLIGNALNHGDEGETIQVQVDGRHPHNVQLAVTNVGVIPSALLPHIFDPFRGGQKGPSKTEGLGLGLYIVQQIMLAHQGTVEVDSSSGKYTIFRIDLPRGVFETVRL